MHVEFIEKIQKDGSFEITISEGAESLKEAIAGKYVFPQKLVISKEQKEENREGLKDIITGAFCLQDIKGSTFNVRNEKDEILGEYKRSMYDGLQNISVDHDH